MEYQVPDLCVRSITPDEASGKFWLDMPSKYDIEPQPPMLVDQYTIDFVRKVPYSIPMCPPGYPNPPTQPE